MTSSYDVTGQTPSLTARTKPRVPRFPTEYRPRALHKVVLHNMRWFVTKLYPACMQYSGQQELVLATWTKAMPIYGHIGTVTRWRNGRNVQRKAGDCRWVWGYQIIDWITQNKDVSATHWLFNRHAWIRWHLLWLNSNQKAWQLNLPKGKL